MKYDFMLPFTTPRSAPLDGSARDELLAEIQGVVDGEGGVPALDPPEYYRVDDRLIEIWTLSPGPVVIEFGYSEVAGSREKLANRLRDLVEMGLEIDALPSWQFDETSEVVSVRAGYASADEARADGRRLLVAATIRSDELRFATGWDRDMVFLVRGIDWYTIRTHGNGTIDFKVNEEPLNAHMTYAKACGDLSRDIEYTLELVGNEMGPFARKVAAAFVQRDAANALLAQARQSLRVSMEGVDRVAEAGGDGANLSELARKLHTDRANLYKLMPSRRPGRRR
ncbi:hypothetical protein [Kribbella speibonae]|uniref:Uncharacterized protein n=1 Tax=Kribbella speibonae TaxID=1572660 RepID=A0A4R0IIP9_9ACTN|nr:hypothetical protein [Kribbella speibonae]TCC32034.1 hypothetical protein E0H92_36665 [Kribbella speibonae]